MTQLQNNVFQPAFIFSDGMVLQRDKKIPIWGLGKAGMTVQATLLQDDTVLETQSTQVKEDGTFYLELSDRAGSFIRYTLVLACQDEKISYHDVLIGEVYLAAGQSNMEFPILFSQNRKEVLEQANNPNLRFCRVYRDVPNEIPRMKEPQFEATVVWGRGDSAADLDPISAVAYSFIFHLYQMTGEKWPVAFVDISKGGARLETFLNRSQIDALPLLHKIISEENRDEDHWGTHGADNYNEIMGMYYERVCPIKHIKVKGILWYQGEGNLGTQEKSDAYVPAFEELCRGFSRYFGDNEEELPVIYAMLAPFDYSEWNADLGLPLFWEAQHQIALNNPDTMREIPIYDLPLDYVPPELADAYPPETFHPIHPICKSPVGKRMAEAAMELVYHVGMKYMPPFPVSYEVVSDRVKVTFSSVSRLKSLDGEKLRGFCICGEDRCFVPAEAEVCGEKEIAVYSAQIKHPVAVTYAFQNLNHDSNLCDNENRMAVPFRSDRIASEYFLPKK